ncbi:MAG: FliM/FliN family flagellar motor switch protein [Myxococcaceae bacterium]
MNTANLRTVSHAKPPRYRPRSVTCGALLLAEHPEVLEALEQARASVARCLRETLSVPVNVRARLLDTTLLPESDKAFRQATFVIELGEERITGLLQMSFCELSALLSRLCAVQVGLAPASRLTRAEKAAANYVALSAIAGVRAVELADAFWRPRLVGLVLDEEQLPTAASTRAHAVVDVSLHLGESHHGARLLIPESFLKCRVARQRRQPTRAARSHRAACIQLAPILRGALLSREDSASLRMGDVVLLTAVRHVSATLNAQGILEASRFRLHGEFGPKGFAFQSCQPWGTPEEENMLTQAVPLETLPQDLPLEVDIVFDEVTVPLGAIASLQPGDTLPLHLATSRPVSLRIGRRLIGRAELLEVEGELAARIIALAGEGA